MLSRRKNTHLCPGTRPHARRPPRGGPDRVEARTRRLPILGPRARRRRERTFPGPSGVEARPMIMRPISRRAILRGAGSALALPLLEAMNPRAIAATPAKPPMRVAFLYVPNGVHMPDWTPAAEGPGFALSPLLQPLEKLKDEVLVLSGLTLDPARAHGDGGGDHARAMASFLTGRHPRKTDGAALCAGVSIDQIAAQSIGRATRFPSLELGCE